MAKIWRKSFFSLFLRFILYAVFVISFAVVAYATMLALPTALIVPFASKTLATNIAAVLGGGIGLGVANWLDKWMRYVPPRPTFNYKSPNLFDPDGRRPLNSSHYGHQLLKELSIKQLFEYTGDVAKIKINPLYWYDSVDMECIINAALQKLGGLIPGSSYLVRPSQRHQQAQCYVAVTGPTSKISQKGGTQQLTPENCLDKHAVNQLTDGYAYKVFLLRKKMTGLQQEADNYFRVYQQKHQAYIKTIVADEANNRLFTKADWEKFCSLNYAFYLSAVIHLRAQCPADVTPADFKRKLGEDLNQLIQFALLQKPRVEAELYQDCVRAWNTSPESFMNFIRQFDDYFYLLAKLTESSEQAPQQIVAYYCNSYCTAVDKNPETVEAAKPLLPYSPKEGQSIHYAIIEKFMLPLFDEEICQQLAIKSNEKLFWAYLLTNKLCEMGVAQQDFFENWQTQIDLRKANIDFYDVMDEVVLKLLEKTGTKGLIIIPLNEGAHWVRIKLHLENTDEGFNLTGDYVNPTGGQGDQSYLLEVIAIAKWRVLQIQMSNFLQVCGLNHVQIELICMALSVFKKHHMNQVSASGYALAKFLQDKVDNQTSTIGGDVLLASITYYLQQACIDAELMPELLRDFLTQQLTAPMTISTVSQSHPKLQFDNSSCGVITVQGMIDDIVGENTLKTAVPRGAKMLRAQHIIDVRDYYQTLHSTRADALAQFSRFLADRGDGIKTTGVDLESPQDNETNTQSIEAIKTPNRDSGPATTEDITREISKSPLTPIPSDVDQPGNSSNETPLLPLSTSRLGTTA